MLTGEPVKTSFYLFPSWANDRRNAFSKSSYGDIISTILIFHFPSEFDPSKKNEWNTAWDQFSYFALQSNGGVVSSKTCGGWAVDHKSFCGMIRYINIAAMKQYISDVESKAPLYSGLEKLKELASEGMDVEFASMYCLENGWLGSVTETQKDNPAVRNMFADMQAWRRSLSDLDTLK
jgi:hypothetical protein